ncbi:hypothetical protein, partial [Burkholderia ambifaria]|uniref:hypothetical protein n=1 Tax=Burkholderia ambifaria TaxID=152480 RepID=UPI001ABAD495
MLLAQQAILANSVVLTSTRITPVSSPLVVGCPLIDHGAIRNPDKGKLHIGGRAYIAVCILEFCVKWRMDAVSVRLRSPSRQGEAKQKRDEFFIDVARGGSSVTVNQGSVMRPTYLPHWPTGNPTSLRSPFPPRQCKNPRLLGGGFWLREPDDYLLSHGNPH